MKIIQNKLPFPHVIVEDMYTEEELFHIWKELDFLTYTTKLQGPRATGTAWNMDTNENLKQNLGVHLDDLYSRREISSILQINRKALGDLVWDSLIETDFSFKNLETCNSDSTLISYYEEGDHYKAHRDMSSYTALTWFYKQPKQFDGGDMYFPEYDYTVEIKNNMTLYFLSSVVHQVKPVMMKFQPIVDDFGAMSGNGRYCMSQFLINNYFKPHERPN